MYLRKNWYVFPVSASGKVPLIKDWPNRASNDPKIIKGWKKRFSDCNWGLMLSKSGLVAIDVDQNGVETWCDLLFQNGDPETLTATSGGDGKYHYVFRAKKGVRYVKDLNKTFKIKNRGIDVKHNGYILIEPSKTKRSYEWVDKAVKCQPMPEWLAKLCEKKIPSVGTKRKSGDSISSDHPNFEIYKSLCEELSDKEFDYNSWIEIGMALHSAFDGGEDGLELWLTITEGVNYEDRDDEVARYKWQSFKPDEHGIGAGTLFHYGRELGCRITQPGFDRTEIAAEDEFEDIDVRNTRAGKLASSRNNETDGNRTGDNDKRSSNSSKHAKAGKKKKKKSVWEVDNLGRKTSTNINKVIRAVNKMGYAMLGGEQIGQLIKTSTDSDGLIKVAYLSLERFKTALSPYWYKMVIESNGNQSFKYVPASKIWLENSAKQTYSEIVFRPNAPKGVLNLWTDIPCEPKDGAVDDIEWFVRDVICNGEEARYKYVRQYLAHVVQKPQEKPSISLALISEAQGVGKGLLTEGILQGLLKGYYHQIGNAEEIKGEFNEDQTRKLVVVIDESDMANDRRFKNLVKNLTGSKVQTSRQLYRARQKVDNFARYIFLSNEISAVMIDLTNRRFLICEIDNKWREHPKLTEMYNQCEDAGDLPNRFYQWLLDTDISDFNPRKFPEELDTHGTLTKVESQGIYGDYWYSRLIEDPQPIFIEYGESYALPKTDIYEDFTEFAKEAKAWEKSTTPTKFWMKTAQMIDVLSEKGRVRKSRGMGQRVVVAEPWEVVKNYCSKLRIKEPENFDANDLVIGENLDEGWNIDDFQK